MFLPFLHLHRASDGKLVRTNMLRCQTYEAAETLGGIEVGSLLHMNVADPLMDADQDGDTVWKLVVQEPPDQIDEMLERAAIKGNRMAAWDKQEATNGPTTADPTDRPAPSVS